MPAVLAVFATKMDSNHVVRRDGWEIHGIPKGCTTFVLFIDILCAASLILIGFTQPISEDLLILSGFAVLGAGFWVLMLRWGDRARYTAT